MTRFLTELTAKMSSKRKIYDAEANDHYARLHGDLTSGVRLEMQVER